MEMRLRWYIDEFEAQIIHHFEEPLAEMNRKMDTILAVLATLQRVDASVVNILREEHLEEEEGETSTVGDVQDVDDRLTYETPNIEVHSEVFMDEALGDTIVEVISPISGKKTRTRKHTPALLSRSPPAKDLRRGRTRFVSIPFCQWILHRQRCSCNGFRAMGNRKQSGVALPTYRGTSFGHSFRPESGL